MKRHTTTVIFDLDGTIADSMEVFIETVEEILKLPKMTDAEILELRGLNTHQIAKHLGVKKWQTPMLAVKGKRMIAAKMNRVQAFDGMPEAIEQLARNGYKLFILSTNSEPAIRGFLDRCNLIDHFVHIYAGASITGKAKRLKRLLKNEGLQPQECVYIGDEVRDIEAAQAIGMPIIAVAWGYSTPEALAVLDPDGLVDNPKKLAELL